MSQVVYPEWQWTKNTANSLLNNNTSSPMGICEGIDGNVYSTSYFKGTNVSFGSTELSSASSGTEYSMYIAKLDTNGIWLNAFTDASFNNVISKGCDIIVDLSGYIYVTGYTETSGVQSSNRVFVNKYTIEEESLIKIWSQTINTYSISYNILIESNALYIAGSYRNSNISPSLLSTNSQDTFIAKLDIVTGNWIWTRCISTGNPINGNTITGDGSGNIYIGGIFYENECKFYDTSSVVFTLNKIGYDGDIYLSKIDSSGQWQWVRRVVSNLTDYDINIIIHPFGDIYITGYYNNYCNFYSNSSSIVFNLYSFGSNDMFIAKTDSSGNWIWVRNAGGDGYLHQGPIQITSDASGVYLTGFFKGTCDFFENNLETNKITTVDSVVSALFIAYIDISGNWQWTGIADEGTNNQTNNVMSVALDSIGNLYVIGQSFTSVFITKALVKYIVSINSISATSTKDSITILWEFFTNTIKLLQRSIFYKESTDLSYNVFNESTSNYPSGQYLSILNSLENNTLYDIKIVYNTDTNVTLLEQTLQIKTKKLPDNVIINLPMILSLYSDFQIYGQNISNIYNYILSNYDSSDNLYQNSGTISAAALRNYIKYRSNNLDGVEFYVTDVSGDIISSINNFVDNANIFITTDGVTPLSYGLDLQSSVTTKPTGSPLYMHFLQFLASILFGHPNALSPIKNQNTIKNNMIVQNLGRQFVSENGLAHVDSSGNFDVIQALYEQLIEYDRFAVNDSNGTWISLPFEENDVFAIPVLMSGKLEKNRTSANAVSPRLIFNPNSNNKLDRYLIQSSTNPDDLDVIPKVWLLKIMLSA